MSATPSPNVERTIERSRLEDVTPVGLDADALESTAPEYLRDLKRELGEHGYVPTRLTLDACFDEDCSLRTQEEVDRIRGYIRAAAFLGAATVTVEVGSVDDEAKTRPALEACAERARRDGVQLDVDGPIDL
jgi:sugar phosphate isomerase/epimerase